MPFQKGNKLAVGRRSPAKFRTALEMELKAAGDDEKELRKIARVLIDEAKSGNLSAINAIADRLDGKPIQAIDIEPDFPKDIREYSDAELKAVIGSTVARIEELTGQEESGPALLSTQHAQDASGACN